MTDYDAEWWNGMWSGEDVIETPPDEILVSHVKALRPGRALELGCGAGSNAIWLAEQGWNVAALDFSEEAVKLGRRLADMRGLSVSFEVGDATVYRSEEKFDLIISFYIQLWPKDRAKMLTNASQLLTPNGKLLFVSHDKSNPPPQWSEDEFESLTTPDEIIAELAGLNIELATVVNHDAASAMSESCESHNTQSPEGHSQRPGSDGGQVSSSSTVVVAVKTAS